MISDREREKELKQVKGSDVQKMGILTSLPSKAVEPRTMDLTLFSFYSVG